MDNRFSSPPTATTGTPRPETSRKRSNSLPIVEALGCSTPEAQLILAEGKAAIRRRHASERPPRRRKSHSSHRSERAFRPEDHIHYLDGDTAVTDDASSSTSSTKDFRRSSHNRIPSSASNRTDGSVSTIKGSTATAHPILPSPPASPTSPISPGSSPLGDYSATLAKFIKSQLNSIPSYHTHTLAYPRSCPDLSIKHSPPPSPAKQPRRPVGIPNVEIPPVRPPLRSAFSEWSSTDESEYEVDELPPLPSVDLPRNTKCYTPSILNYYENSSFLLPSTPLDSSDGQAVTAGIPRISMPPTSVPRSEANTQALASSPIEPNLDSSSTRHSRLTSSSVPSLSSSSSYFDYKNPITLGPHLRNTVIAAVTPPEHRAKVLHAISPFEGGALTKVHSILVESNNRVQVEGMSFDILGDIKMPVEGVQRVSTPC